MTQALRGRPCGIAERIEDLRLALLVAGLAGDVAPELAAIARSCDRERRREHEVRIVILLGMGVMGEVIAPIGARIGIDRISAQPLAQREVARLAAREATMRAV